MPTDPLDSPDAVSFAFSRLLTTLAEDALFVLAARPADARDALEGLGKRRGEAYVQSMKGGAIPCFAMGYGPWVLDLARTLAAIAPPAWLPMHEVVSQKVTLEVGARGLRSLFTTKPSDKDVARVKRLGGLAVRVLRAVLASDGALDEDDQRILATLVASLGLPDADAQVLLGEEAFPVGHLELHEVEAPIARALVQGAWLAAANDAVDPREESVIREIASRLALPPEAVESARAAALETVEMRRLAGVAVVDAVRYVLNDRIPGAGVRLAALAGSLVLPRRYRDENLAQVGHNAPVVLARRFAAMTSVERRLVLAMAWAAALAEDPTVSRKTVLRWRYDRFAADLGEDGTEPRRLVEDWIGEIMAETTRALRHS